MSTTAICFPSAAGGVLLALLAQLPQTAAKINLG
jgi:hypothetical protein